MMTKNEGQMDRAARLIVGLILLVVGSFLSGWLQIVLYLLAIIVLVTAATGYCLLYKLLNFNTLKGEEAATKTADTATADKETPMAAATEAEEANLMVEEEPVEETKDEETAMPTEEATEAEEEVKTEEVKTEEPTDNAKTE